MDKEFFLRTRKQAVDWSRDLLKRDPTTWVILDTETTGLGNDAQVIQIGVIDGRGNILMDNVLVKPTKPIPSDATAVHHITNDKAHGVALSLGIEGFACAMLQYAEWFGDWNDYHKSFRWQKLQGGDHSALGDCHATLDVIRKMAESAE